jgi:cobalt-zinc-cadmium resistance protein CzcA
VKVFGDDMDVLNNTANKIAAALKAVPARRK